MLKRTHALVPAMALVRKRTSDFCQQLFDVMFDEESTAATAASPEKKRTCTCSLSVLSLKNCDVVSKRELRQHIGSSM